MGEFSIYVHIPFCLKKCSYCGFSSYEIPKNKKIKEDYINSLIKEIERTKNNLSKSTRVLKSIYLGGGTPSLLNVKQVERILDRIFSLYEIKEREDIEISIEVNPGTADIKKLLRYKKLGVNRFTLGVQSFLDKELKALGRIHSAVDAKVLLKAINNSEIKNCSLDLIYGIPGQKLTDWLYNLKEAVSFLPKHISAYNLTIEPGTKYMDLSKSGRLNIPDDESQFDMFANALTFLENSGFNQYEISNFTQKGFRSVHNSNYWERKTYLGIGAGAHSFLRDKNLRYWNEKHPDSYVSKIEQNKTPIAGKELLEREDQKLEELFLSLRQTCGITLDFFKSKKNPEFKALVNQYRELGYITGAKDKIILSTVGQFLSNEITEKLSYFM